MGLPAAPCDGIFAPGPHGGDHALTCHRGARSTIFRHDVFKTAMGMCCVAAGLLTEDEPRLEAPLGHVEAPCDCRACNGNGDAESVAPAECRRCRADLLVRGIGGLGFQPIFVDVVLSACVSPPGLRHVSKSVTDCVGMRPPRLRDAIELVTPLRHLASSEESKHAKYAAWQLQHSLVPAACDSYGGMGLHLQGFIKRVAAHATAALGAPSRGFLSFWRTALECELHRGFAQSFAAHFWSQTRGIPASQGRTLRGTREWGLGHARAEVEAQC